MGSMIPLVDFAQKNNFSCIILNPNEQTKYFFLIRIFSEFPTMSDHCQFVWDTYIKKNCPAKKLAIIAHSAGGYCVSDIYQENSNTLNFNFQRMILKESKIIDIY